MPYYALRDLNKIHWNRDSFEDLKNVLTQACFAVLRSFETCRFVHNDLHLQNILVRKTTKKQLDYGEVSLPLGSYFAVIMDFEKSSLDVGEPRDAYFTIRYILNLATSLDHSDLSLAIDVAPLNRMMSQNAPVTTDTYRQVKSVIDGTSILYKKSKLPPNLPLCYNSLFSNSSLFIFDVSDQ